MRGRQTAVLTVGLAPAVPLAGVCVELMLALEIQAYALRPHMARWYPQLMP